MKIKIFLFAVLHFLLLVVTGCTRFHPPEKEPAPYEVTFKVEGQAPQAKVALYTPSHPHGDWESVALPFSKVETIERDKVVMLSAGHVEGGKGELLLTVSVNGKVVKTAKTSDPYKHATAQIGLSTIDLGQQ